MDELRFWNKTLHEDHIRQMMNQEIIDSGIEVLGEVVPLIVHGPDTDEDGTDDNPLLWSNLDGYYRMDQIFCGYLEPFNGVGVNGKLRNITTEQEQTAPLPYTSAQDDQFWDTDEAWTHYEVWDPPNSLGVDNTPIDWNIAKLSHNMNSGDRDITLQALFMDTEEKLLTMAEPTQLMDENNDGQGIHITHYLLLDGNIDLVGESQLVQKRYYKYQYHPSILVDSSAGYVERDQQGTRSSYNYNYWSSPVSYQGAPNNAPFTIESMLLDGTDSKNPGPIDFSPGKYDYYYADGPRTNPIKLSQYWFWKFNGTDDDYDSWIYIGATGELLAGEGYTQKGTDGSATIEDRQNYVFRGKPNNGSITLPIEVGNDRLVGNPYPCAIDANEFILDNIKDNLGRANVNKIDGTIYYWDHFGGATHILSEYIGGYATYNLIGAAKAISTDYRINATSGSSSINPERYIPVGQGFFVVFLDGGDVTFRNSQRVFKREHITLDKSGSYFFKSETSQKEKTQSPETDGRKRIRITFDSPEGYHRQLLVGLDTLATNGYDNGYDAPLIEKNLEDMYWMIDSKKYIIQGVNNFGDDQVLPLGLKIAQSGLARIKLTSLENIEKGMKLYIFDNRTGKTHKIDNHPFEIFLEKGIYNDRFSLVFQSNTTKKEEAKPIDKGIITYMNNMDSEIVIQNSFDRTIKKVELFNILGQRMQEWEIESAIRDLRLPVRMSIGAYIINVTTNYGELVSKKVIIE
jgi:hypothetical protein